MSYKYTSALFGLLFTAYQAGAQAFAELDINEIRARVHSTGLIGPDLANGTSAFVVPSANGAPLLYSSGLWLGGLSPDNQLKLAAHLNGTDPQQFWPGPLTNDGNASITPQVSAQYDQVWKVEQADVVLHRAYFDCMADPGCDVAQQFPGGYTVPDVFINWPAMGNVDAGQDLYLAPFFDYDNDGNYDPYGGDHPCILGDQALFAIYNDMLPGSGGQPIGVEIRMMPFAYTGDPTMANTVFVHYKIINQGTQTLLNFWVGQFADLDLGCGEDDLVGTDAPRGLIYAVNGDEVDESCLSTPGFGNNPPAFGMVVLKGPLLEPDAMDNPATPEYLYQYGSGFADGIIDNERHGLSGSMYWLGQGPVSMNDPATHNHFYNYLRGNWKDNLPLSYGGTGYSIIPPFVSTDYAFPGESDQAGLGTGGVPQAPWSEVGVGNVPGDRRGLARMGPGTLEPGEHINLLLAYVYARAEAGGPGASVAALQQRVDSVRAFALAIPGMWNGVEEGWPMVCDVLPTGLQEQPHAADHLALFPNPASAVLNVATPNVPNGASVEFYDVKGACVMRARTSGNATIIDVSGLRIGLYTVRISGSPASARFLKE